MVHHGFIKQVEQIANKIATCPIIVIKPFFAKYLPIDNLYE